MTKQEFLDNLRASLGSRVSASLVEENVRYYEDYINTQIRMNRSEEAVLAELGDPRLLARSIADAEKRSGAGAGEEPEGYTFGRTGRTAARDPRFGGRSGNSAGWSDSTESGGSAGWSDSAGSGGSAGWSDSAGSGRHGKRLFRIPLWLFLLLFFIVVSLIIGVVFSIFSYLAPILIPVVLIVLVIRWIRNT